MTEVREIVDAAELETLRRKAAMYDYIRDKCWLDNRRLAQADTFSKAAVRAAEIKRLAGDAA